MAKALCIKRCWFHKNHYDIPKRRMEEIMKQCEVVGGKQIVEAIVLNKEESLRFVKALLAKSRKPTARMKKALKAYRESVISDMPFDE